MGVLFSAVIKLIKKRIEFSLELVHYNQIHTRLNFQNNFSLLLQLLSDSAHPTCMKPTVLCRQLVSPGRQARHLRGVNIRNGAQNVSTTSKCFYIRHGL